MYYVVNFVTAVHLIRAPSLQLAKPLFIQLEWEEFTTYEQACSVARQWCRKYGHESFIDLVPR